MKIVYILDIFFITLQHIVVESIKIAFKIKIKSSRELSKSTRKKAHVYYYHSTPLLKNLHSTKFSLNKIFIKERNISLSRPSASAYQKNVSPTKKKHWFLSPLPTFHNSMFSHTYNSRCLIIMNEWWKNEHKFVCATRNKHSLFKVFNN